MKEIIIKCPDEFSQEQVDFIKQSAINQIDYELKKSLKIPQAQIDACEAKIEAIKEAMGMIEVELDQQVVKL